MYAISHQLYIEVAERLMGAIGGREFFSGSVGLVSGDVECKLICTLFIKRSSHATSEGRLAEITDIIPVWWEFHTTIGSEEIANDFSFKELIDLAL